MEKTDARGKIYIGFDKNDVEPRAGRKGRMIDDNEERYPSRSEMAGGWAGGEKGLRAFIQVTAHCWCCSRQASLYAPIATDPCRTDVSSRQ